MGTMATQSPFAFLESILQSFPTPQPPDWLVEEGQRRIVLLLNHVLQQEPAAMERLVRQKGNVVRIQWQQVQLNLMATPAGLLDLAGPGQAPDLTLVMTQESPFAIAQTLMQGEKPAVRVEGDVQLAAEVNWLADHVRWDAEEDLSRIVGDAPAHMMVQGAQAMAKALRQFVQSA